MTSGLISRQHPERIALVTEDGRVLRYAELHAAIERCAADLPARQLIFIVGDNDLPSVLCYLAAQASGAVPLLLGRSIHPDQLAQLLDVYRPALLFTRVDAAWLDARQKSRATQVRETDGYGLYALAADGTTQALHPDLALLLATSGSTGSPKLVRLTGANLVANAASIADYLEITPDERAITSLPFNYSYGLSVINSHLYAGASVVLTNRSLMDAGFWRTLNAQSVTSFAGVPYSYDMLLRLRLARIDMPSVRTLTQAGGRMDPAKLQQVAEACRAKGIRFVPMYGQTEATARIAWLPQQELERKPGSIGRAIPGGRLWIEHENGGVVGPGETGELVYAGPNVSMGYAQCADDLALGDALNGVLHTGDLARYDEDGAIFIEGRLKRFLKVFGIRVSLDALERMAAAQGVECAATGSDDSLVVHAIQTPDWTPQAFRDDLARRIGVHPSALTVNGVPALPRLPTGKVDYLCLALMS
ncbi:AMP-binding protein [Paraburkholderia hospita]|uniref:AMP-binding protein n=1 Tax=Paraburkholderia hospita TaxID=169430 RepID=UPI000271CEE5|nr:AMP-binding protein [Paraburkholderia hospita]EUC21279.1 o-succinylbenzoate--CoA ligase [Burkholderia sp. BT03]SKC94881.1 Acyl-CoA synthetase (AMP-forming)/AMP-acid ligase II [Paraburkholderia hospita]